MDNLDTLIENTILHIVYKEEPIDYNAVVHKAQAYLSKTHDDIGFPSSLPDKEMYYEKIKQLLGRKKLVSVEYHTLCSSYKSLTLFKEDTIIKIS